MLGNSSRHAAQLWRVAHWPAFPDTLPVSRLLGPALSVRWLSSSGSPKEDAKGTPYDQLSIGVRAHTTLRGSLMSKAPVLLRRAISGAS